MIKINGNSVVPAGIKKVSVGPTVVYEKPEAGWHTIWEGRYAPDCQVYPALAVKPEVGKLYFSIQFGTTLTASKIRITAVYKAGYTKDITWKPYSEDPSYYTFTRKYNPGPTLPNIEITLNGTYTFDNQSSSSYSYNSSLTYYPAYLQIGLGYFTDTGSTGSPRANQVVITKVEYWVD